MRRLLQKIKFFKIDWTNQLVSFLGTIIGILIALQLQNWQETENEKGRIESLINAINLELKANKLSLEFGIGKYGELNRLTDLVIKYYKTDSTILVPADKWTAIKADLPNSLSDDQIIKKESKQYLVKWHIEIDFFPPRLYSDNWEVLKVSGLLHLVPHAELSNLMRTYGELSRNYSGLGQDELLLFMRSHELNNLKDVKELNTITSNLVFEYNAKLKFMGMRMSLTD